MYLSNDLNSLLRLIAVERVDKYLFIGNSPSKPSRIFGGQVLAQALHAASDTVDDARVAHSMHAYFLRPGDPTKQIVYEVDPIRDGRSFTTRRVVAKQDGNAIFNTAISFHVPETGLSHCSTMPAVPSPQDLQSDEDFWRQVADQYPERFRQLPHYGIERRPVSRRNYLDPQATEPEQHIWFRVQGELGDELSRHQTALAFMSDFALLGTALFPHPLTPYDHDKVAIASLDHAIWFHRPFRADDYLLYSMDSPSAEASRGFSRGSFFSQSGELVASTVQESLLRLV